jgi:hypothetical protein
VSPFLQPGGAVPPGLRIPGSYIYPIGVTVWTFEDEILQLLPCLAFGTYREDVEFNARCLSICQRPDNPCIVDIDFVLEGDGEYEIVPDLTLFSLDTTDGFDGTWHLLQPIETDPQHFGQYLEVHGEVVARYVADMCDHVSTFFSEPRICFRLTFREKQEVHGTFGSFQEEEVPPTDPKVTPTGGCRQILFGSRLPRA